MCQADIACNTDLTCTFCAEGYYLSGGKCLQCSLKPNCKTCDPVTPANCNACMKGFYLADSGPCVDCTAGCAECLSDKVCLTPTDGYYIAIVDNNPTGISLKCAKTCLTCI